MKKIKIFADNNKKSQKIKKVIKKKIKMIENNYPNLNIVIGGDGFMLQIIKKKYKPTNMFYGINSGNYGFLMNRFSKKFFLKNLKNANIIKISPLEMIVKTNNTIKKFLAVNEVSILRQSRQAAYLSIKYKNNFVIKNLISDGVLVSTPAGSTAYNLSVYGPILNLNQKKLSIAPISAFRPRRWKGKVVSDTSKIIIKNLDSIKRPVSAVADNVEVRNAKIVQIKIKKKIKYNLLYDRKNSLLKKINLEKLRKEK
jgi:NAD+ kinase